MFINQLLQKECMKRGFLTYATLILIIALFSVGLVYSEEHSTTEADSEPSNTLELQGLAKSYQWLYETVTNRSFDTYEEALSLIALLGEPSRELSGIVEELRKKEDVLHCWPKGACKTKESAVATLALRLAGQEVTEEIKWLKDSKIPMESSGEWLAVIKSNINGTCEISYGTKKRKFEIVDDIIKQTRGQYYINVNEIDANILRTPTPKLIIDCSSIPNTIITLLYKPNANDYFIQYSEAVTNTELTLANGCYGVTKNSNRCDYESTAFASWALLEMGEDSATKESLGTIIYLESGVKQTDAVQLALLNRILLRTGSMAQSFLEDLTKLQKQDGSFNSDVYATSVSLLALEGTDRTDNAARAADYLNRRINKDGSWNRDVRNTAFAILSLHGVDLGSAEIREIDSSSIKREVCGNSIDDDSDGVEDCGEEECKEDQECEVTEKPAEEDDGTATEEGCKIDSDCMEGQECNSGVCIEKSEETTAGVEDVQEKEKSNVLLWIIILIVTILVGGGVFYLKYIRTGKVSFKDIFKKKKKIQTYEEYKKMAEFRQTEPTRMVQNQERKQTIQPRLQPQKINKSKDEEELERSLREAEKLIKGK